MGGKITWKSTSSSLNYLPSEFEQRDEVEFTHGVHPTHSGSRFSRRLFDIFLTSSRHPCKHSLGSESQWSLLKHTATEKLTLDDAWNKFLIERRHKEEGNFSQGIGQYSFGPTPNTLHSAESCEKLLKHIQMFKLYTFQMGQCIYSNFFFFFKFLNSETLSKKEKENSPYFTERCPQCDASMS